MNNFIKKEETSNEAQLRERLGREARRRLRLERARAVALLDGEGRPVLTKADVKALAEADRVEAKAVKGKKGAPSIRAQAARQRTKVGVAMAERAEARRADLRMAQTVELEAAREGVAVDQVVEAKRGQKDKRVRTRDGLKMLHESGALSAHQLAVGLRYRDRYEIAQTTLGSCLGGSDKAKVTPTLYTQCRAAQRRAGRANAVRVLEAAVSTRLHPDALIALRLIAGEARTVNSITTAARRRVRLAEGLGHALTICGDMLAKGH